MIDIKVIVKGRTWGVDIKLPVIPRNGELIKIGKHRVKMIRAVFVANSPIVTIYTEPA